MGECELTEFAAELSEFSLPKHYSRNSIPPVSYFLLEAAKRKKKIRIQGMARGLPVFGSAGSS